MMGNCEMGIHVLCSAAVFSIFRLPTIVAISIRASISSFDWKSGNLPVRNDSRIVPADHTSIATFQ